MIAEDSRWLTEKWWLSPYNYADEVRQQFSLPTRVYIHDVTLREAMQSPRVCLRPEEKIRIAKALDKLGVDSIENGAYMSEVEKEVTKELVEMHGGRIWAESSDAKRNILCFSVPKSGIRQEVSMEMASTNTE